MIPVPTLEEVIDDAIVAHEKCARYAVLGLTNHRRVKAALDHLEKGELEEVRQLLNLVLNDNGDFAVKRMQKITDKWFAEYAGNDS
jgi:hypothetical protein